MQWRDFPFCHHCWSEKFQSLSMQAKVAHIATFSGYLMNVFFCYRGLYSRIPWTTGQLVRPLHSQQQTLKKHKLLTHDSSFRVVENSILKDLISPPCERIYLQWNISLGHIKTGLTAVRCACIFLHQHGRLHNTLQPSSYLKENAGQMRRD